MEAYLSKRVFTMSEDMIILRDGTEYYITNVERAMSRELTVVLDANPIEKQITCYYSDSQGWTAINYSHRSIQLSDELLYELSAIRSAVEEASK